MSCIFCRIIAGQAPADVIYEDESVIAFRDTNPQAPVHVLVIPREHVAGPLALGEDREALAGKLFRAAALVARQEGIADSGYRLVMNEGRHGQQSVLHAHLHVLGGRQLRWPPG